MVRAGQRAEALTRQLLAFSRQQVLEPRVLDLNEVLRSMERLMSRVLGEDIAIQFAMAVELGSVRADRGQLEQVIMNLAVNSRDAMPRGGRLVLETSNLELDEAYTTAHFALPPGPYVVLSVSDTGCGMDDRARERAFEPFFTTKGLGRGTGLGLSTVFGIIKQSEGAIAVHSAPGQGTTFRIYLPRVFAPADAPDPCSRSRVRAMGTEHILLVEDDDQVRAVARALLSQAGYDVIDTERPERALQIVRDPHVAIDLLLTDIIMPTMNGRELADLVLAERPGIRVLFMSGYTSDVVLDRGGIDPNANLIEKPFTQEILTRRVREALDARDAHSA
jgi:CheY-like chemotaxis protein